MKESEAKKNYMNDNIGELLPILQEASSNVLSEKNKLENKTVGYIAFVSLVMATLATFYKDVFDFVVKIQGGIVRTIFFIVVFGVIYWGILSVLTAILALKPRTIAFNGANEMTEQALTSEQEEFRVTVIKAYIDLYSENYTIDKTVSFFLQLTHLFIVIMCVFFGLFLLFFLIVFLVSLK